MWSLKKNGQNGRRYNPIGTVRCRKPTKPFCNNQRAKRHVSSKTMLPRNTNCFSPGADGAGM